MLRTLVAASFAAAGVVAPVAAAPPDGGPTYRTIGDYTHVNGFEPIRVEAVGLVTGLPKTGGDPPPGLYRDQVLKLMRENEVEAPEKLLASKTVAAVLLRGYVPPGARKGDVIDVEVIVAPNDNETSSLRGGYLLPVKLGQKMSAKGQLFDGRKFATADGPVLLLEPASSKNENAAKIGRILGRAKILEDRDFVIDIAKEHRSSRLAKEIQTAINARFFASAAEKKGPQGIANAKSKTEIHVSVPSQYKYNVLRFLHVCRRVPVRVSDRERAAAVQELKQNLMEPGKAYDAALRLEAMGLLAVTPLKEALAHPKQIVRFSAAESLAYLGDARGIKELANLAEADSLYRPYAIAALASPRLTQSQVMLTKLLHSPGAETRYGAFRALWLIDHHDPLVMGEKLGDDCTLHVLATNAEPMVHVASRFRPEIVVFGKGQKFQPPVLLRAADHLIVQHEGQGEKIIVTSIRPGKQPVREESSPDVEEVIRKAAKVGAKYPDLVELLRQAAATGCLQCRFEINALPKAVTIAELAQGGDADANQLPNGLPSMFQGEEVRDDEQRKRPTETTTKKEEPKKPWWKILVPSFLVN